MDELFTDIASEKSSVYPVVLTPQADGSTSFAVPDFPSIRIDGMEFGVGIQLLKEKLNDEMLTMFSPPSPTPANQIQLGAGQMILQVAVG